MTIKCYFYSIPYTPTSLSSQYLLFISILFSNPHLFVQIYSYSLYIICLYYYHCYTFEYNIVNPFYITIMVFDNKILIIQI